MKNKGQSLIEFLIALKVVLIFITGVLALFYIFYSLSISSHFAYRGLLCLEEFKQSQTSCEKKIESRLRSLLFLNKEISVTSKKRPTKNTMSITYSFLERRLKITKEINRVKN